jgi:hypothetical protein
MPRWIIVVLVVACLLWLGGAGMRAFGDDGGKSSSKDPGQVAERWFGGLGRLFPEPATLDASDVTLSGPCGAFPSLEIPAERRCRVVILEQGGRRRARIVLDGGRADLTVEPPQGRAITRELESGEDKRAELRFDDDGGALELHCRSSSGSCDVRFIE